jgi:hypothetical protein
LAEKALVTREDLAQGALLIQALDQRGFPVSAAFWAYEPVLEQWRLIIAAPAKSIDSLLSVYQTVQGIIDTNDLILSLNRMSFISDRDPKVRNLRALAQSGTQDVIEAPTGPIEVGDRILDNIHLYRIDALRYERRVFEALQRLQPLQPILQDAKQLDLPRYLDIDFVIDASAIIIAIEAKYSSRPVGHKIVWSLANLLPRLEDHFRRSSAIVIVSSSGFRDEAIEFASQKPSMRLVKWIGPEDDDALQRALLELLDRS